MSRYATIASTAALVIALGGGGAAVAGGLGKNSVGSKQLKNGAVKTVDLADGAVAGGKVDVGSLAKVPAADTLDGLDSSAFARAGQPTVSVHAGTPGAQRTLTSSPTNVASLTFTAPADGFVRLDARATFRAGEDSTWVDVRLVEGTTALTSEEYWEAGDIDGHFDSTQSLSQVVAVKAGVHTYALRLSENSVQTTYSVVWHPQVVATWFPAGSIAPAV